MGADQESVAVVGAGRVGTSLAVAFHRNGVRVCAVVDHNPDRAQRCAALAGMTASAVSCTHIPSEATAIVVAVPDDALEEVSASLLSAPSVREGVAVIHTSGAVSADVLGQLRSKGVSVGSAHPIMTFTGHEDDWRLWQGTYVGIEGDNDARLRAASLMRHVGAIPVELPPHDKALYHLACVFASNYMVALYFCALRTLVQLGIDEPTALRMLAPLAERTIANIAIRGPAGALTGPIARGDLGTVTRHLRSLENSDTLKSVYVALGKVCVQLARTHGDATRETLAAIDALLDASLSPPP